MTTRAFTGAQKGTTMTTYLYSFDLSDFEAGKFVATKFAANTAVSGDWVCYADSDEQAMQLAMVAAYGEWLNPSGRNWDDFVVEFVDASNIEVQQ